LWRAEVVQAGKRSAAVRAVEPATPAPELTVPVVLVISVLKADKMDDVVRDAVMLGVTGILPVVSERSEISLAAVEKSHRVARWQRIAVSSAKQCGRAVVPVVGPAGALPGYLAEPVTRAADLRRAVGVPGGRRSVQEVAKPAAAHVIVGPGGWTADGVTAIAAGAVPLCRWTNAARGCRPMVALTAY
jgi:16S rRNA (uracil1498-N3)-methyltransferase